ncbi:MAG: TonB family protein [Bryobacterales bacterium]|nr:TonB family protein [Bryobacterales bacterium]
MSLERIGNYEILGELGRGGMGVVYRGVDSFIKRPVAIKTIYLSEIQEDHERQFLKERLYREAQSAGILSHPNIVTIYQIGEQDDITYIAMEFVDGKNLAQLLRSPDKPSVERLLSIFEQTAAGLDHAHAQGVVHRDIKPANIIVRGDGVAKITDFGVAKITSQTVTRTGMTLGTPHYMAPEQIQGKPVDGRADQYSLGVVIYEVFTGHKPFKADTMTSLIFKIVTDAVDPKRDNPNLNDAASDVLKRALAKDMGDRFSSCQAMVQAFRGAIGLHFSASHGLAGGPSDSTRGVPTSGTVPAVSPGGASPRITDSAASAPLPSPVPSVRTAIPVTVPTVGPPRPPTPGIPPNPAGPVPPPSPPATPTAPQAWQGSQSVRDVTKGHARVSEEKSWRFPAIAIAGFLALAVIFVLVWVFRGGSGAENPDPTKQAIEGSTPPGVSASAVEGVKLEESTLADGSAEQPDMAGGTSSPLGSEAKPIAPPATGGIVPATGGRTAESKPAAVTGSSTTGSASRPVAGRQPGATAKSPASATKPASGVTPGSSSTVSPSTPAPLVPEPPRPEQKAQPVFTSPKPIVRVPAIYPAAARRDGISGSVMLQAVVNEAGQTTAVTVMRGIRADLDQAAKDALAKWRFQPGTSDGKPVESRINVEISFNLVQDQRKPISLKNP